MEELIEMIKTGNTVRLKQVLNENPSLAESKTEMGISLLQFAVYCSNNAAADIIKDLVSDLDIFEAASLGEYDLVIGLLNINPGLLRSFSADGFSALGLASYFGHFSVVKLLLDMGADPNTAATNQMQVAPIHSACAISNFEITELLISRGADVNLKQMQGVTPIHSAAHNGQTKIVKLLFENGADLNARTDNGQTPLSMAEEKDHKETAVFIRNNGGM